MSPPTARRRTRPGGAGPGTLDLDLDEGSTGRRDAGKHRLDNPRPDVRKITLQDVTRGETFTKTVPYTSTHGTAEWIEETPLEIGTNPGLAALPNLTSPVFDQGTVNGKPANLKSSEAVQLADSNGNIIGSVSAPDPDLDGFNACTWSTTCSAPSTSSIAAPRGRGADGPGRAVGAMVRAARSCATQVP